ncbi:MAG: hypothetical protein IPM73_12950 [Betaproteobacteria bacterium]|nr:hypothetical protein [Betaproteobacteria bacterium]
MLILDAADQQQNTHAGEGFDMVQVVGAQGVTLNLAQAEIEIAIGSTGTTCSSAAEGAASSSAPTTATTS